MTFPTPPKEGGRQKTSRADCGAAFGGGDGRLIHLSPPRWRQLSFWSRPTFFDLSPRVKLRLTGADVDRYLNGQITNDLRKANTTSAIQASILNAKGN